MGSPFAVFLLIVASAIAYLVWSVVNGNRSLLVPVVAMVLATGAGLGAWYAWAESQSLPWAAGYSVIAVGSLIAAGAGWVRGKRFAT